MSALRLILVEDESLVAIMMEDMLADLGCEVVESFAGLSSALTWLENPAHAFDGAILDVNLGGGEMVFPLAQALRDRGVPFVFATGYGEIADERFARDPLLHKPVDPYTLSKAVEVLRAAA